MPYACSKAWHGRAWLSVPLNGRAPPPAKRRSGTQAAAAIPDVRTMAKLFGSAAYAILNELTYYHRYNLKN
eukprot:3737265-Pleurochrysis_carterae.AAC.1